MIGVKPKFNLQYFDRSIIKKNWSKINEEPIKKSGLLVRRIARGSIRRGGKKKKPSRPGTPPRSHGSGKTPPFKMIFSVPNRLGTETVVGMVSFGNVSGDTMPVPGLQEQGGTARRRVFVKAGQHRTKKGRFGKIRRKPVVKTVRYDKRPFMQPALQKAKPRLPKMWEGSLSRVKT